MYPIGIQMPEFRSYNGTVEAAATLLHKSYNNVAREFEPSYAIWFRLICYRPKLNQLLITYCAG